MDQSTKLKKFEAAVLSEINVKTELITSEAQAFKLSELEKNNDEQLLNAYTTIQKKSQEIKKKLKSEVAKFGLDSKRAVLVKRNEITQNIFDDVTARLLEFYNSSDYDAYLLSKLQKFSTSYKLSDVTIMIGEKDYKNIETIASAYSLPCTFIEDKSIKLGGFIVQNAQQGLYFDETLKTILADQREYFILNSNLFL